MKKPFRPFLICVWLAALTLALMGRIAPSHVLAQTSNAVSSSKEACLGCHGPYEKLASLPPTYLAPSGEKINPHMYVPHETKQAKAIPECTDCHDPHSLPPDSSQTPAVAPPQVLWCYTSCHHTNSFKACKDCHK